MSDAPVLVAEGLRKRYADGVRERWVVDGVDLSVRTGEWVALAGPSGSGKTTLLGLLGGLAMPTTGDVRIHGRSIVHMRDHHRSLFRRRHVGFVFQELSLVSGMTLLENVLLPLVPEGGVTREATARAEALLERLGLVALVSTTAERLSGGEKQRGAIARALLRDPALLLLDEPTAHIDAAQVEGLVRLLEGLRGEGRAIVTSTHDPRLTGATAIDRVVRLEGGKPAAS